MVVGYVQSEYVVANQRHKTRDKRFLHHQESSPGKLKVFAMTSQGERAAMRATALKAQNGLRGVCLERDRALFRAKPECALDSGA
jgi:hypothetical protein